MEKKSIGFGAEIKQAAKDKNVGEILKEVMPEDFVKFGLIPELIGRIPVVTSLDNLDEEALIRILKEPKNALLKQYTALFEMDGVKLTFEPETLEYIVDTAVEFKLGARGLRSIVETIMMEKMFEIPSSGVQECNITKEYAQKQVEKSATIQCAV
jgi:ATP-dependent Clp protease ATP-binding subunit ClpX